MIAIEIWLIPITNITYSFLIINSVDGRKKVILMKNTLKPGQKVKFSGQYEVIGPRGGHTGHEVTLVKGEPAPPTMKSGQKMVLVDKTKH